MSNKTQETSSRSEYTPEMGDRICAEIIDGKSVRSICKEAWAPARRTIVKWLRIFPQFRQIYDLACAERAEGYAEELIEIADDASNDWMATNDPDNPGFRLNKEHVMRSRLRVDTRKWICAKMNPKYADRVSAELTGANGGPIGIADVTEAELARRIAFALASGLNQQPRTH